MNPSEIDQRRQVRNPQTPSQPTNPVSRNISNTSGSSQPSGIRPEKRKELVYQYQDLRSFVMKGINQIREELLPVLFYLFVKTVYECEKKDKLDFISKFKQDFTHIPKCCEDIQRLIDSEYNKSEIQTLLSSYKIIIVTQFTFEAFMAFQTKAGSTEFYRDINEEMKITIKKSNEVDADYIKMPTGITSDIPFDDLKRVNDAKIKLAPLKDDVLSMTKIESFYVAKRKNELKLDSKKMKDKLASDIDIPESACLEKSEIPLPEIKYKSKVDFAKAYLDRAYLDENSEPNIINVSVRDPLEQVTCIEIEKGGNVMIYGFLDGKILLVVLNPAFDDINALEKKKKQTHENISKTVPGFDEEFASLTDGKGKEKVSKEDDDKYEVIEFRGHEDAITSISLNYDELYALSSSVDTTIRLWCFRQRTCVGIFKGHINTVWKAKFCSKGYYFASGSSDTTARIWSTDRQSPLRVFVGHKADVNLVEFFENCNYLISASHDKTLRIWEVSSGKCVRYFFNNNEVISSLAISYYGHYLAVGSEDGQVIFYDLEKNSKPNIIRLDRGKRINGMSFSIDETYLVVSSKKRINYYNIERLKNEQKDMYSGVMKQENKVETNNPELLASNSFYANDVQDYDFVGVKFSIGNFIYALSRSHN